MIWRTEWEWEMKKERERERDEDCWNEDAQNEGTDNYCCFTRPIESGSDWERACSELASKQTIMH